MKTYSVLDIFNNKKSVKSLNDGSMCKICLNGVNTVENPLINPC